MPLYSSSTFIPFSSVKHHATPLSSISLIVVCSLSFSWFASFLLPSFSHIVVLRILFPSSSSCIPSLCCILPLLYSLDFPLSSQLLDPLVQTSLFLESPCAYLSSHSESLSSGLARLSSSLLSNFCREFIPPPCEI